MDDSKTLIYFSKDKIAEVPVGGAPTFAPGDPIYALVQFAQPQYVSSVSGMGYGYQIIPEGGQPVPMSFSVDGGTVDKGPEDANSLSPWIGFWIIPPVSAANSGNVPANLITTLSGQPAGTVKVSFDDDNTQVFGSFAYDAHAGKEAILGHLSSLQNAGNQDYLASADKQAESIAMDPAVMAGSQDEAALKQLVAGSELFVGKEVRIVRFVGDWSQATRDQNAVMYQVAEAQVAVYDPANQRFWLWLLQIRKDPMGMTINMYDTRGIKEENVR